MRRGPGFTAVIVLSLALGIGLNTAIFSLIDTLMFRALPVRDPGRLVELLQRYPGEDRLNVFPWHAYEQIRDHNQVFSGLIAASATWHSEFRLGGEGIEREQVAGEYVTGVSSQSLESSQRSGPPRRSSRVR